MDQRAARALAASERRCGVSGGRQPAITRGDRCGARGTGLPAAETMGRLLPRVSLASSLECPFSWLAYRCELLERVITARRCQDARVVRRCHAPGRRYVDRFGLAPARAQVLQRPPATEPDARRSVP